MKRIKAPWNRSARWSKTDPRSSAPAPKASGPGQATAVRERQMKRPPGLDAVTVVLPVYNEQACIAQTFDRVVAFARQHPSYTFLFVNDGSTDHTREILADRLKIAQMPQLQMLSYFPRAGKGFAIKTGMDYAEGDYLCYLDSDLAYSLEHLGALVECLEAQDMAIGSRSLVASNPAVLHWSRRLAGKMYNWMSRAALGLGYRDMQAGLKGFRRDVAKELFAQQSLMGFSFDVELIYLAKRQGYRIGQIPAQVSKQHQQKTSKVNLLSDSLRMFKDLLQIRWNDLIGRYR
jgi:dolichyl-phosphate beta-glucosyltransferase